jgi:hypothetical protein
VFPEYEFPLPRHYPEIAQAKGTVSAQPLMISRLSLF